MVSGACFGMAFERHHIQNAPSKIAGGGLDPPPYRKVSQPPGFAKAPTGLHSCGKFPSRLDSPRLPRCQCNFFAARDPTRRALKSIGMCLFKTSKGRILWPLSLPRLPLVYILAEKSACAGLHRPVPWQTYIARCMKPFASSTRALNRLACRLAQKRPTETRCQDAKRSMRYAEANAIS